MTVPNTFQGQTGPVSVALLDNNFTYLAGPSAPDVFICTAGQTTFTMSVTPTNLYGIKCYLNGLRLTPTTDYTWTSGTTLTLTTGATLNDELLVERT